METETEGEGIRSQTVEGVGRFSKSNGGLRGDGGRICSGEGVADGERGRVFGIVRGVSCGGDGGLGSVDGEERGMGGGDDEGEVGGVGEEESGIWTCCGVVNRW